MYQTLSNEAARGKRSNAFVPVCTPSINLLNFCTWTSTTTTTESYPEEENLSGRLSSINRLNGCWAGMRPGEKETRNLVTHLVIIFQFEYCELFRLIARILEFLLSFPLISIITAVLVLYTCCLGLSLCPALSTRSRVYLTRGKVN